ncbi:MAG: MOSC N-terminal beta barrel domain-containing protein, partial [Candidatus Acidiferrum sp.]
MPTQSLTPRLANIRLHPIKALDPFFVSEAIIGPNGGLELDRVWALYSADGRWVNGKRTPAIHSIRAAYAPDASAVTLTVPGDRRNIPAMTFAFPRDTEGAAEWFSMYFEQAIQVRYTRDGFPDDGLASGPTIISTASLEAVCEWFPGMALDEARRRFRATLEIDGVPAFWEDQLFAESETSVVRFKIGEI